MTVGLGIGGELSVGAAAWAQSALADLRRMLGALSPAVTQDDIGETICFGGWTPVGSAAGTLHTRDESGGLDY